MNSVTVIDARMGRGKSSAAVAYMNTNKGSKRFLYITPYLSEVDRICECCDFEQPDGESMSKSAELKYHLRRNRNVAATHSLFYLMDDEMLALIRERKYSLIIDESIEVISKVNVTRKDFLLVTEHMTTEDELGCLHWVDESYTGKFSGYKDIADSGSLFRLDSALISVLCPELLRAFEEVFMLTYMFDGQYQKAYLDYFGFEYRVCGVERDGDRYRFSDRPDDPPPEDFSRLLDIVDDKQMNAAGDARTALSKNWYGAHGYDSAEVRELRKRMDLFFRVRTDGGADSRLWTCFKEDAAKLVKQNGRYRNNFLQLGARATNRYRSCTNLAYMVNRFADPNITKFFAQRGITIDADAFAMSEMLQWIWRSAIRDNEQIHLYIPSKRMRTLLLTWVEAESRRGETIEELQAAV